MFAERIVRWRKMLSRTSGSAERCSITTKATSSATREDPEAERVQREPALLLRLDEPVDERDQSRGDRDRAGDVEGLVRLLVLRLRDVPQREHEGRDPDREVDEEDPGPGEEVGQDPAEQQADRAAAGRDRAPDAHRLRPLLALGEGRGHDRESRGRDERRAEALQPAGEDQELGRGGEPVQQRGDREDDEPREEQPLASDQVARAAAEKQEAAEDQRVGVDDPLQLGGRHVEIALDRGQRDVHDRRVQDDHELRDADEDEDEPRDWTSRSPASFYQSRAGSPVRFSPPWRNACGRSETGSRRSAARRSATTPASASAAARCGATSSRARPSFRPSARTAAARRAIAVRPARRRSRRRSRSSARSAAPRCARRGARRPDPQAREVASSQAGAAGGRPPPAPRGP